MVETEERSVINSENYSELVQMLKSNDEGSVKMALTILEQSNFDDSKIYILCAIKETFDKVFKNAEIFSKEYPSLHKNITQDLVDNRFIDVATLSFKRIYELAVSRGKVEEVNFMLNIFKNELVRLLTDYGFSFLDYLDIEIKPKKEVYAKTN